MGFVVFSPSTIKIPAVVEVTDPVLVTSSVVPTVVAPNFVLPSKASVVNPAPIVPETSKAFAVVSDAAPTASRSAVSATESSSVMLVPLAVTVPTNLFEAPDRSMLPPSAVRLLAPVALIFVAAAWLIVPSSEVTVRVPPAVTLPSVRPLAPLSARLMFDPVTLTGEVIVFVELASEML